MFILISYSTVLLEKLTGFQLVKKFPTFYGTPKFITAFTSARHLSLSCASSIQFIPPHHTSSRSILILSSLRRLGLPSGFFPSGFPTKPLYTFLHSPIRATCPGHLVLLDFITYRVLIKLLYILFTLFGCRFSYWKFYFEVLFNVCELILSVGVVTWHGACLSVVSRLVAGMVNVISGN